MESKTNQEVDTIEQIPLIDILYKDTYRVDSFIAQITSGVLRSMKHQHGTTQGSTTSIEGGIPTFAKGGASGNKSDSKSIEELAEPHDNAILELLNSLDLQPISKLPKEATGKLVHFRGNIFIRNINTLSDIINLMADNSQLFGVTRKDAKSVSSIVSIMSKVLKFGLEIELLLDDGSVIIGNLKEKYLLETDSNLLKSYGTALPGKWNIIGMIDDNKANASYTSRNDMRKGLDEFAAMPKTMYLADTSGYILTPILIFRELTK